MSEGQEPEDKTHEASERQIERALERGDAARSQEVTAFLTLAAGSVAAAFMLAADARGLMTGFAEMLANLHRPPLSHAMAGHLFADSAILLLRAVALPFVAVMAAAVAGNLLMHPVLFTTEPLMPKANRISPMSGFKRLFGQENLVQFAKTLAKLVVVGAVVLAVLWPDKGQLQKSAHLADPASIVTEISKLCIKLFGAVLALYAVIALADALYQRFAWRKRLRMSHEEVKQEHKESEGSPEIKAKLRQLRRQRVSKRMMAAVPQATVIITNPTHYAVALRYEKGMAAPVCLAKGVDEIALKIREVAGEHRIPLVENRPLARALYASAEVDEEIPVEHYKAVAEIIGYVLRLRGRRR